MAQAISTTLTVTSVKGKVHTNQPINPLSIVRIEKVVSRWDGREYNQYPAILIEIVDEGVQYWFYARGDEAVRDSDYTALDALINNIGGGSPLLYDAVVDAGGDGDYLLPSEAVTGGSCSIAVLPGDYAEVMDIVLGENCKLVGMSKGVNITFPATFGIKAIEGSAKKTSGTISVTNGSDTVTNSGSFFALSDEGKYIKIGLDFFKVLTFNSATSITIDSIYEGKTQTGLSYFIKSMITGVTVQTLNLEGGGVSDILVEFQGVLDGTIKEVNCNDSSVSNISIRDCGDCDVENVKSKNSGAEGVSIVDSQDISISQIMTSNNSTNGIYISASEGVEVSDSIGANNDDDGICLVGVCLGISIKGVKIWDNAVRGIQIESNAKEVVIDACQFKGNNLAISNGSSDIVVSNCYISGGANGVNSVGKINISNCDIDGCTATGLALSTAPSDGSELTAINVTNCTTGILISSDNNTLSNCSTHSNTTGFNIDGDDNMFSICKGYDNSGDGFNVSGDRNMLSLARGYSNNNGIAVDALANDTHITTSNLRTNTTNNLLDSGTATVVAHNLT